MAMRMINLVKDWLISFLPHALSKINRVHYGLVHDHDIERWKAMDGAAKGLDKSEDLQIGLSRELLAVPFVGKDVPARNSEFAHPEVLIGLTILAYRYEGLRQRDLNTIVRHLKSKVSAEKGPYAERPTAVTFKNWVSNAHAVAKLELEAINKAERDLSTDGEQGILPAQPHTQPNQVRDASKASLQQLEDEKRQAQERVDKCELLLERDLDKIHLHEDSQVQLLHAVLAKAPEVVVHYLRAHVFPRVLEHQHFKLAASGVDLGSKMLFGTRLGFSGTPSNLLPMDLRPCHFEPGSEAQVVRVSTDPSVMKVKEIKYWSVKSIIKEVRDGGYNALIDTGALITGFTNEEVCIEILRDGGAPHVDVAVFLNARDEKMVLDRYGAVYDLSRCGVALKRRFTFYDQVHTTGMDIKQALDARAACTLGKDMTLRDHAQGLYRMRGLARGQTVTVLVVDEVRELILESVSDPAQRKQAAELGDTLPNAWEDLQHRSHKAQAKKLEDILAWLLLNSMRSEHLQHMQLCQQSLHSVWRQRAFKRLLTSEAPSEAGQAGDQIAARGGILASAVDEGEDEAMQEPPIPHESLLLTRFASKPLDEEQAAEKSGVVDEQEELSVAQKAAFEIRAHRTALTTPACRPFLAQCATPCKRLTRTGRLLSAVC